MTRVKLFPGRYSLLTPSMKVGLIDDSCIFCCLIEVQSKSDAVFLFIARQTTRVWDFRDIVHDYL